MKDFIERLTNVFHLIGVILTGYLIYQGSFIEGQYSILPNDLTPLTYLIITILPSSITWLIKYILTGDKNPFPYLK